MLRKHDNVPRVIAPECVKLMRATAAITFMLQGAWYEFSARHVRSKHFVLIVVHLIYAQILAETISFLV